MTTMAYGDDSSLQRWGANLGGSEEAAREVEAAYRAAEEKAAAFRATFGKIRTQGETELPASNRLMADLDSVHSKAKDATRSDEWRSVAADCGTLPATYRREHETDQDRLDTPRRSRQAEKRADVHSAEQDN